MAEPAATGLKADLTNAGGQKQNNTSLIQLLTAIGTGCAASFLQILIFVLIKNKLVRILWVTLRRIAFYFVANVCLSVNRKHISSPRDNEQNRRHGVPSAGSYPSSNTRIRRLSTSAASMPTSSCDTCKHSSSSSYRWHAFSYLSSCLSTTTKAEEKEIFSKQEMPMMPYLVVSIH